MFWTARPNGRWRRAPLALRLWSAVARLLFALAVAQTGELIHDVADMVEALVDVAPAHESCPDEDEGRGCPPGCPTCHCSHFAGAVPGTPPREVIGELAFAGEVLSGTERPAAPGPVLPSVYRPPRFASRSS